MCTICFEARPGARDCLFATAAVEGEGGPADLEVWSLDRIAEQLLTGYWGIAEPRAFAPGLDRTLTYDLGDLSADARAAARAALGEWSAVTGVTFVEVGAWRPAALRREDGDAAASTGTTARLALGEAFEGRVESAGDRDWVRVDLAPEQLVTIRIEGAGGSALATPEGGLRDAAGTLLPFAWRAAGGATEITVASQGTPVTIYVEAGGLDGATGGYRLSLRDPGATGEAQIAFGEDQPGAFASVRSREGEILGADVNVAAAWLDHYGAEPGAYGFQAYLHEIGHALGLGHAGDYNGAARYGTDALYANDSWQASVMSYFSQRENTAVDADAAFVATPMAADLLAVRRIYDDAPVREGDTVYGENSTAGGTLDLVAERPMAFTVIDTGGRDRLDLAGQAGAQRVDLRDEAASDVFGLRGNMVIARGTVIEEVRLGRGDDEAWGNGADNRMEGGHGADVLRGLDGDDALRGGRGEDRLEGGEGDDDLVGGRGDDVLEGGAGRDVFRFDAKPFGRDLILDFGVGGAERIDLRRLPDLGGFDDLSIRDGADGAVIDLGDAGAIRLLGIAAEGLGADDFTL